jgi:hypothetical protein
MIRKFYRRDDFTVSAGLWIDHSSASEKQLHNAIEEVGNIVARFSALHQKISVFTEIISFGRLVKVPQVSTVIAALHIALPAVVIHLGNDYLGFKEVILPSLVLSSS